MKTRIKPDRDGGSLALPASALAALDGASEAEVVVLRPGLLLVSVPGALERLLAESRLSPVQSSPAAADADGESPDAPAPGSASRPVPYPSGPGPSLSEEERDLLRALIAIRYEERTVPLVDKRLGPEQKRTLDSLVSRGLLSVYKDAQKYPKGVYSISKSAYVVVTQAAAASLTRSSPAAPPAAAPAPAALGRSLPSPARPSVPPTSASATSRSPPPSPSRPSSALPLNSVEHLIATGFMVLNNETEARQVMPYIGEKLKNEDVKGIRGFDKRYYVLRRSFLIAHEGELLARLDAEPATVDELAAALSLPSEGVQVLLTILGDSGEVIEKRKGQWMRV